jgi:integrase
MIKRGIDPRAEERRARETEEAKRKAKETASENAFELRARQYLRTHCQYHRQLKETTRLVERELIPAWKGRRIEEITRREIKDRILDIKESGRPGVAHNCLQITKTFFQWACDTREFITENPAAGISAKNLIGAKKPRQRTLNDPEIVKFWAATAKLGYPFGSLCRFLLLTGLRLREAANATWSEIEGDIFTVPEERFKSEVDHIVPLSRPAKQLLDELPLVGSGKYVFTLSGISPISGFYKWKEQLDEMMGVSNWRIHDLRRTLRTGLAKLKVPDTVAELAIGHGKKGLQRVYDQHQYRSELRDALEAWAGYLRDLTEPPPDNVTQLDQAKRKRA